MFKAMSARKFYFRSTKNCMYVSCHEVHEQFPKTYVLYRTHFNTKQRYQLGFFFNFRCYRKKSVNRQA